MKGYESILNQFGKVAKTPKLFEEAFTHSSYVHEHPDCKDYERIEFVGDAVLDFVVAIFIYKEYPSLDQGIMTKLRASIVCGSSLAGYAKKLHFGEALRLGKGEELCNGRNSDKILEDVFEAFIGACYLDFGFDAVVSILQDIMMEDIKNMDLDSVTDYKSKLQEYVQTDRRGNIEYQVVKETGTPQNKMFYVQVLYEDMVLGRGQGTSKKRAEQDAAHDALKKKVK